MLERVEVPGQRGCWRWGPHGQVFCGDGAKEKAEAWERHRKAAEMRAIVNRIRREREASS